MPLEGRLDVSCTVLQTNTHVLIALVDPLHEHLRYPEQLVLAGLPHYNHHVPGRNAGAHILRRSFL